MGRGPDMSSLMDSVDHNYTLRLCLLLPQVLAVCPGQRVQVDNESS